MTFFKTVIKYIFGQILFLFRNSISYQKISKASIKLMVYSNSKNEKLINKIKKRGFKNFINIIDNNKYLETTFHYEKACITSFFEGVPETNAQLIVFASNASDQIHSIGSKPHYIFVPFWDFFKHFTKIIKYVFLRKFFFNSFKFWGEFGLLFENKNKENRKTARRFIPFQFSRINFLNNLYENNINFVVLRWFDDISSLTNLKEDIDILISDKSLDRFSQLLDEKIGILPLDVYSSTGEKETSYAGLPYYPVKFANAILEHKTTHKDGFFVPNKYYHMVSLIYHVVFHKSLSSGLSITEDIENTFESKRNFKELLAQISLKNGESFETITLENLYRFLKIKKLIPEYDLILKLKNLKNDAWFDVVINDIRKQYFENYQFVEGLSVFLLRAQAVSEKNINSIINYFDDYGFDLLEHSYIESEHIENAQNNIRGGKWDIGEFEVNAGKPLYYFVLFDSFNKTPSRSFKKHYPNLENEKATKLKIHIRHSLNAYHEFSMNAVHSSDDFFEAVFYLEQLGYKKEAIKNLIAPCVKLKEESTKDSYSIIKDLSRHACRAKVELIDFKNNLAVKKTYKPNKLDYLEREVWFLKIMSDSNMVPKLIKEAKDYVIMEYIKDASPISSIKKKMSSKSIMQFRNFFETLYAKGITILDINASNVLIDTEGDLKFIDFEYAQKYSELPTKIIDIYELGKIPLNKVLYYPKGHELIKNAYNLFWKRNVYLTKYQFFNIKNKQLIRLLTFINKFFFDFNFFFKKNSNKIFRVGKKEIKKVFNK